MAWGRCKESSLQIRRRIDNRRNKVERMQFSRLGAASLNLTCTSILMHIMNTSISPDHRLDKWWMHTKSTNGRTKCEIHLQGKKLQIHSGHLKLILSFYWHNQTLNHPRLSRYPPHPVRPTEEYNLSSHLRRRWEEGGDHGIR